MERAGSAIVASAYCVPETKLTHQELCDRFGQEAMDRIAQSSGIWERRVAAPNECASDLAYRAAEVLFSQHKIEKETVDLIIFATQTPDYLLPTTACILQNRLGLPKNIAAFDINLGCSQYVYAVSVAHSFIAAGMAKRSLVMTGDTVSRILSPDDRAVVPLFGDAGTATLIERSAPEAGFQHFVFGTDGSGHEYLIWPKSGLRDRGQDNMYMDGKAIFIFTLKHVPEMVTTLLAKAKMSISDVDLFIFHQASELIVESSAKKLKIPKEKLHYRLSDLGNSGGSTVGITLTDAWQQGRIKPGMNVVLTAFGVGLSWGATLIKWPDHSFGPAI